MKRLLPLSSPKQADPAQAHMQCENCSIVLENLWEGQKRRRNRVQWWRWLGNQIHGSASKGTGSLCSAYWSARNVAGLLGIIVNSSWDIMETLHFLHIQLNHSAYQLLVLQSLYLNMYRLCVSWISVLALCLFRPQKSAILSQHECCVTLLVQDSVHLALRVHFWKFVGWAFSMSWSAEIKGGNNSDSHCII